MRSIYFFLGVFFSSVGLQASPIAVGGSVGGDLPFARKSHFDPGVSAEGSVRVDPYEIRFHYADTRVNTYSLVLAYKYFLTNQLLRPYGEVGLGPVVVHTEGEGLGYGARPEIGIGADLGINPYLSLGVSSRYYAMLYFGSTKNGKFESNHGMSIMGSFSLWF